MKGMISFALRTGKALPQVTPCPLLDRYASRHHGLNVALKEDAADLGFFLQHDISSSLLPVSCIYTLATAAVAPSHDPRKQHKMTDISIEPYLSKIPKAVIDTAKALKTFSKLEKVLQELAAKEGDTTREELEKKLKPVLTDAGVGKKGA